MAESQRVPGVATSGELVLRRLLCGMGIVAGATGTSIALRGAAGIPGGEPGNPSNDSVMRFYAVWWAAQGPALWRLSRQPSLPKAQVHAVCATTFLGGLARVIAARQSGRPHALFQFLTVVELVLPLVLVVLRHRLPDRT